MAPAPGFTFRFIACIGWCKMTSFLLWRTIRADSALWARRGNTATVTGNGSATHFFSWLTFCPPSSNTTQRTAPFFAGTKPKPSACGAAGCGAGVGTATGAGAASSFGAGFGSGVGSSFLGAGVGAGFLFSFFVSDFFSGFAGAACSTMGAESSAPAAFSFPRDKKAVTAKSNTQKKQTAAHKSISFLPSSATLAFLALRFFGADFFAAGRRTLFCINVQPLYKKKGLASNARILPGQKKLKEKQKHWGSRRAQCFSLFSLFLTGQM